MGLRLKSNSNPGRNELCPCQSGLKYKHCHGDPFKIAVCNRVANEKMCQLILEEKIKKGQIKLPWHCNSCGKDFIEPTVSKLHEGTQICPECGAVDIVENEQEPIENKE
jgi:hypothetical protein